MATGFVTIAAPGGAPGGATLQHFGNEIVAKMELEPSKGEETQWLILGRVVLTNADGDRQDATARLVHDTNQVLDEVRLYIDYLDSHCVYLQAGLRATERETVTLECNTYNGAAGRASLVAIEAAGILWE